MGELLQAVKENVEFLLLCLLIFLALFFVAMLVERKFLKTLKEVNKTRRMAYIAIFSVLAAVLMFFEVPLFFAPSFYEIDFSEVPVLISTFYLGPVAGVTTELLKIVLKLLLKGTSTAFVGDFANFVIGCSFVLPASILYHTKKSKGTAIGGMALGTACMTVFGSAFNAFYLIPTYSTLFGMPLEAIVGMGTAVNSSINSVTTLVLFAVVPFNLLKGVLVSIITFLLYKRVEKLLVVREQ
ncbi:MAG: ECF transporter S component [Oscillospiraceae bacterium]|jgi:riboflavin transporter FmnP|nr:ECF transporter S component [Oscillospiraceae bacterium]